MRGRARSLGAEAGRRPVHGGRGRPAPRRGWHYDGIEGGGALKQGDELAGSERTIAVDHAHRDGAHIEARRVAEDEGLHQRWGAEHEPALWVPPQDGESLTHERQDASPHRITSDLPSGLRVAVAESVAMTTSTTASCSSPGQTSPARKSVWSEATHQRAGTIKLSHCSGASRLRIAKRKPESMKASSNAVNNLT